jgi:hypothetical protein
VGFSGEWLVSVRVAGIPERTVSTVRFSKLLAILEGDWVERMRSEVKTRRPVRLQILNR